MLSGMSAFVERWGCIEVALAAQAPVLAPSVFSGHPWGGVARILDRAPSLAGLRAHRLQLLAAARLRERGLPVSPVLAEEVRLAHFSSLAAAVTLKRVAAVVTGPILVIKGPEVAAHYPAPALRPYTDIDILVPDAERTQGELLAAGFRIVGPALDWSALHHLPQVSAPDLPVVLEVHRRPRWIRGLPVLDVDEIVAEAVPSALGIEGVLAPRPAMHVLLLVANAWSERPLERLGDLVDIAAAGGVHGRDEVTELAAEYGLGRAWRATMASSDTLLLGAAPSKALRTWARNLPETRGRTVLESHAARFLGPLSGFAPRAALQNAGAALVATVRPAPGEGRRAKLRRARRALRHALLWRSEHERMLDNGERDHS